MTHKDAMMDRARQIRVIGCRCPHYECETHEAIAAALLAVRKETLEEGAQIGGCNVCGGKMVYIRGRYPGTDNRLVCPTCAVERLEQIRKISSPDYGQASQATGVRKLEE